MQSFIGGMKACKPFISQKFLRPLARYLLAATPPAMTKRSQFNPFIAHKSSANDNLSTKSSKIVLCQEAAKSSLIS